MSNVISTDHPLSDGERATLTVLLDTLIPPSEDGAMPGAGDLDLRVFMDNPLNPEFDAVVRNVLGELGENFATLDSAAQETRVANLQTQSPADFAALYMQTLAVYYQQDSVLRGIGSREGPPFPRGNEVIDGDMSLLDPVVANPKLYRPA